MTDMDASLLDTWVRPGGGRPPVADGQRWVETRWGRLHVLDRGDPTARPVLLVPDPPNVVGHLTPLIEDLSRDHRVIAFELPGFGFSKPAPDFRFTIEQAAATIIELLERLTLKDAILAVTCVSVYPALRAAVLRPDLIAGLVLGQASTVAEAKVWAGRVDFKGMIGTPVLGQLLMGIAGGVIAGLWYPRAAARGFAYQPLLQQAKVALADGARFALASAFQALQRDTSPDSSFCAKQPAIILWGEADRTHRRSNPQGLAAYLHDPVFRPLAGCGHFPDLEAPQAFAQAVRDVLPS